MQRMGVYMSQVPQEGLEVLVPCSINNIVMTGTVAGTQCAKLKLDPAAQQTIVKGNLVPRDTYINQFMDLKGAEAMSSSYHWLKLS